MNDSYSFKIWTAHHGYSSGSGDFVEVKKHFIWNAVKNDPDFWKMKLYEIKVTIPGYLGPAHYETSSYLLKNKKEAEKIGKVISVTELRKVKL